MNAKEIIQSIENRYGDLWLRLENIVTSDDFFHLFKQLSDNYSPTLTVSRVQGPLVESFLAENIGRVSNVKVIQNFRGSGTIGIAIGQEPAPVWFSGHADICSYLTGPWDGEGYPLTPFCMHRARPGRRLAMALGAPTGSGPLDRIAEGEMVTGEDGRISFETNIHDLPLWSRVVHHLPATWQRESDEFHGFIDNQGTCAALILAARFLSHYDVNVLLLLNDEEEGPVDKGNQGFSRALGRLLNRTPHAKLPEMVFVSDVHQQESRLAAGQETFFGQGALFTGASSGARGAVTPPQLLAFTRELAVGLSPYGINITENDGYVSRSDDISALHYTQNINLIGFAGVYPHFDRIPTARVSDVVHLARTLIIYALIAQDVEWRRVYL